MISSSTHTKGEPLVADIFKDSHSGAALKLNDGNELVDSSGLPQFRYENELLVNLSTKPALNPAFKSIQTYFDKHPYPVFEPTETLGALIERSLVKRFPEMLNRSLPINGTVLDAGCGTGELAMYLSIPGRNVIALDVSLESLRRANHFKTFNNLNYVTFAQANIEDIAMSSSYFDAVICDSVLPYCADPSGTLKKLAGHLKQGGHIILGFYSSIGLLKRAWGGAKNTDPRFGQKEHDSLINFATTISGALSLIEKAGLEFVRAMPSTVFGSEYEMEYKQSLFDPERKGSVMDRFANHMQHVLTADDPVRFVVIARKL